MKLFYNIYLHSIKLIVFDHKVTLISAGEVLMSADEANANIDMSHYKEFFVHEASEINAIHDLILEFNG